MKDFITKFLVLAPLALMSIYICVWFLSQIIALWKGI